MLQIARAEPFVQIVDLGDYSITYRAAGLLVDVKNVLSVRSHLRGAVIDELHAAGIEIVSPSFMNTRALQEGVQVVPARDETEASSEVLDSEGPETVIFDKAEEAEALEELLTKQGALEQEIKGDEQRLQEVRTRQVAGRVHEFTRPRPTRPASP